MLTVGVIDKTSTVNTSCMRMKLPGGISAADRSTVWEMMVPVEGRGEGFKTDHERMVTL